MPTAVVPAVGPAAGATAVAAARGATRTTTSAAAPGCYVALGLLLLLLIAGAAYLLPRMFESAPEQVAVPDLIGLTEERARAQIGDAGLTVGSVDYQADATVARDQVISQDPNRSQYVEPGSDGLDFVVSTGKPLGHGALGDRAGQGRPRPPRCARRSCAPG